MPPSTLLARIYLTADTADFTHYKFTKTLAADSLEEVSAFPIEIPNPDHRGDLPLAEKQQQAIHGVLETIFDELNQPPTQQWAQEYRAAGNRSLSVGDVVSLGETAWVVAPVGYEIVSTDDLATAIVADRDQPGHQDQSLDAAARQWAQQMAERVRDRRANEPVYLER